MKFAGDTNLGDITNTDNWGIAQQERNDLEISNSTWQVQVPRHKVMIAVSYTVSVANR